MKIGNILGVLDLIHLRHPVIFLFFGGERHVCFGHNLAFFHGFVRKFAGVHISCRLAFTNEIHRYHGELGGCPTTHEQHLIIGAKSE